MQFDEPVEMGLIQAGHIPGIFEPELLFLSTRRTIRQRLSPRLIAATFRPPEESPGDIARWNSRPERAGPGDGIIDEGPCQTGTNPSELVSVEAASVVHQLLPAQARLGMTALFEKRVNDMKGSWGGKVGNLRGQNE